jgi:hypothetical protein
MEHMTNAWYESYRAAILETDWAKMRQLIEAAELEIHERQRVLSLDHGGTPEERQAIADALHGITHLKTEASEWQKRQTSQSAAL